MKALHLLIYWGCRLHGGSHGVEVEHAISILSPARLVMSPRWDLALHARCSSFWQRRLCSVEQGWLCLHTVSPTMAWTIAFVLIPLTLALGP